MGLKKTLYNIFEPSSQSKASRLVNGFIYLLIIINVVAVIASSEDTLDIEYGYLLELIEIISIVIFSIEYIIRIYISNLNPKYQGLKGGILYILSPLALIDLFAILPFYLPFIIAFDLRFLRVLRLLRALRILKLSRYSKALRIIGSTLSKKKYELGIVIVVLVIMLILSSSLMYMIEGDAQPEKFSSIISTMWWSITTISTVGYGDIHPVTGLGKVLASLIAIIGIAFFALPTSILGAGFIEEYSKVRKSTCPHCGKEI